MKTLVCIFFILLLPFTKSEEVTTNVNWRTDYKKVLKIAKNEKKKCSYVFYRK